MVCIYGNLIKGAMFWIIVHGRRMKESGIYWILVLELLQNSKDKSNLYGFNPLKTLFYEFSLENIAKQINFRILRYTSTKKIASKRKEMFVSNYVIAKLSPKTLEIISKFWEWSKLA